jgi:AraC-like DNA-binding protein
VHVSPGGWSVLELTTTAAPPNHWIQRSERVGDCELVWLRPEPLGVRSAPSEAAGRLKLVAVARGAGAVWTPEGQGQLEVGQFVWLDADLPFELELGEGPRLLVQWPAAALRSRHPHLDLRSGIVRGREHEGERVLAAMLGALAAGGEALAASSVTAAGRALVEAVGMCPSRADVASQRVSRALVHIERHLGDPGLTPEAVADAQRVSRRFLDGLLSDLTGRSLAEQIRLRRLERAKADLASWRDDPVSEIARRWGFGDASHFSRLFRQTYGLSPSAFRRETC